MRPAERVRRSAPVITWPPGGAARETKSMSVLLSSRKNVAAASGQMTMSAASKPGSCDRMTCCASAASRAPSFHFSAWSMLACTTRKFTPVGARSGASARRACPPTQIAARRAKAAAGTSQARRPVVPPARGSASDAGDAAASTVTKLSP